MSLNSLSTASRIANRSLVANQRLWLSTSETGIMCDKMAFIGTGKMAQAMIRPLITKGYQPEEKVAVYDVSAASRKAMKEEFPNIQTASTIEELVTDADMVVLAVKPQNITQEFWDQFPAKENIRDDATLISILAGSPISQMVPSGFRKIVRAMPNTPATIGQGMSVWCCTPNLNKQDRKGVQKVLKSFGKAVRNQQIRPSVILSFIFWKRLLTFRSDTRG
jgi:pyrroline-5-carboxylate reductase